MPHSLVANSQLVRNFFGLPTFQLVSNYFAYWVAAFSALLSKQGRVGKQAIF